MGRAIAAFVLLGLGALNGLLAGIVETCTQNSPDSLYTFPLTIGLNLIGMVFLCWEPRRLLTLLVAALPALAAMRYSGIAIALFNGTPACTIITGSTTWEPTGGESDLAIGWAVAALIFWIGLAYALAGGYRRAHDRDADDFT